MRSARSLCPAAVFSAARWSPILLPHGLRQAVAAARRRHKGRRVRLPFVCPSQGHDLVDQAILLGLGGGDQMFWFIRSISSSRLRVPLRA